MFKVELLYHLFALGSLVVFSGYFAKKYSEKSYIGKIMQGFLFAGITCLLMMFPYILAKGLVFDGRSIVISLCTLFFGPLAGIIPTFLAMILRIYIGGVGVYMGTSVIISSFLVGWLFHYLKVKGKYTINGINLLVFGITVHLIMAFLIFTLPGHYQMVALKFIALTIIIIYPIITVLAGLILTEQESNRISEIQINESEKKFRLLIQNSTDMVLVLNPDSTVKYISPSVKKSLGYEPEEIIGHSVAEFIKNQEDLTSVQKKMNDILNNPGLILQIEVALLTKDGNTVIVESIGQNQMIEPVIN